MVTYWDPLAGTDVTKEFYTGDVEANVNGGRKVMNVIPHLILM